MIRRTGPWTSAGSTALRLLDFGQRLVDPAPHEVEARQISVEFHVEQRSTRAGPVRPVGDAADRDPGRRQALGAAGGLHEVAHLEFGERRVVLHESDLWQQPCAATLE